MPYWEITPYHDRWNAESCVLPAETDEDHHAALDYAKERLEGLWDQAEHDKTYQVTITLRSGQIPDLEEE
jgi:hypothetical protein